MDPSRSLFVLSLHLVALPMAVSFLAYFVRLGGMVRVLLLYLKHPVCRVAFVADSDTDFVPTPRVCVGFCERANQSVSTSVGLDL